MIEIIDKIRSKIKNASVKNRITRLYKTLSDITLSKDPTPTEQLYKKKKTTFYNYIKYEQ